MRARVALIVSWLLLAGAVRAVEPSGCLYPMQLDELDAVFPGDRITPQLINKWQCMLLALQRAAGQATCSTRTVPAGARLQVDLLVPGSALTGTETLTATVRDEIGDAHVVVDGVGPPQGNLVPVWVFNQDADNDRSAVVCIVARR